MINVITPTQQLFKATRTNAESQQNDIHSARTEAREGSSERPSPQIINNNPQGEHRQENPSLCRKGLFKLFKKVFQLAFFVCTAIGFAGILLCISITNHPISSWKI